MVEGHPSVWAAQVLGCVYTAPPLIRSALIWVYFFMWSGGQHRLPTWKQSMGWCVRHIERLVTDSGSWRVMRTGTAYLLKLWPHNYHTEQDISSLFCQSLVLFPTLFSCGTNTKRTWARTFSTLSEYNIQVCHLASQKTSTTVHCNF
jgi:hypothetical protein